jgi:hypothetical protein
MMDSLLENQSVGGQSSCRYLFAWPNKTPWVGDGKITLYQHRSATKLRIAAEIVDALGR